MLKEGIKTKKGSWSRHDEGKGMNAAWMSSLVHILANAPSRVPLRFLRERPCWRTWRVAHKNIGHLPRSPKCSCSDVASHSIALCALEHACTLFLIYPQVALN